MEGFNRNNVQPNKQREKVRKPGSSEASKNAPVVTSADDVITKINESIGQDKYIVLFIHGCEPSRNSMSLLTGAGKKYERYNVETFRPRMFELLNLHANEYKFNTADKSVPVIFYSGQYIGGYEELKKFKQPKSSS
jgi:glutaredoxin